VEVRTDTGWLVILDAGTGIRELGRSLVASSNGHGIAADIFLSHAHWDHIQGIPFFAPIFQQGNRFTIWGSKALEPNLGRVIRDQMHPVVFPVPFEELEARIDFGEIAERHVGDGYEVKAFAVQHPGGALGYRFADRGKEAGSFVYISDNELNPAAEYPGRPADWKDQLVEFVRGAKLLVHDATYTADEYERHRGWGHSTYEDAVTLALDAGVEQLVLFHHRPERTDEEVDRCVDACRALVAGRGSRITVMAAAEGMTLSV
jgi:ribonuclease BN (tRNA processing enzyme)